MDARSSWGLEKRAGFNLGVRENALKTLPLWLARLEGPNAQAD
ncbi:hypothetical protein RKLH11_3606 [Rhodobacteraceae bacterium KLH11]|nr:hypothetical protein RKLH11_3606 [Rhodobacteraceae bacterium KLH11]